MKTRWLALAALFSGLLFFSGLPVKKNKLEIHDLKVSETGKVTWTTENEAPETKFEIYEYRWKKFISVGHVRGEHSGITYSFQLDPACGYYRIRVKGYYDEKSASADYINPTIPAPVTLPNTYANDTLRFSGTSRYEVVNMYGNIVSSGCGAFVIVKDLPDGGYFINLGSEISEFTKR